MTNTFQGHFPNKNTNEDGFSATSPITKFPPNGYALYDMAENIWQWTSDWYRPDYYRQLAASGTITRNPTGPDNSLDPAERGVPKRVMRGGSFLCTDRTAPVIWWELVAKVKSPRGATIWASAA
jgi:sulfatase modifying factor 1